MIPVPLDPKVIDALEFLGFEPNSIITIKGVKAAFKVLARQFHPDAGGTEEGMRKLNDAYEDALAWLEECICKGFVRNPRCPAHEEMPESEERCSECGGTKKIEAGPEWARVKLDCQKCTQ